ncbi:MAG: hypothetical protein R3291_02315 [Thermoplasmata archaeon]|nr:hypothetical protein [Thermoplasmata archaeon]
MWAAGLYVFLLGLTLIPWAWSGAVAGALFFVAIPGAALMRLATKAADPATGHETNI